MISAMFESTTIPILEQVVNFTQRRHNILAGNIANLDTPGYRVRDLSPENFQAKLKQAIEARKTSEIQLSESSVYDRTDAMHEVSESLKSILYHDDSNVSIEHQIAEISKNQGQHNLALTILTHQFRLLQAAISERT